MKKGIVNNLRTLVTDDILVYSISSLSRMMKIILTAFTTLSKDLEHLSVCVCVCVCVLLGSATSRLSITFLQQK